jgi:glutathione S-transferase
MPMPSNLPALVTLLALALYMATLMNTGRQRRRCDVRAPAVTGPPEFERAFRVQQNTLEQLILFLPALWLFAYYASPRWGGLIGLVWLAGRAYYAYCYYRDPETRGAGFVVSFISAVVLWLGALIGCVIAIF